MNDLSPLHLASKAAKAEFLKRFGIPNLLGHEDGDFPIWRKTSSSATAVYVTDTGAAVLEPGPLLDKHLPRMKSHAAIIRAMAQASGFRDTEFVGSFLKNVIFWHHQSRNGRWSVVLGRYERWGVMPVKKWAAQSQQGVSERTFHDIKDWAIDAGLIEAKSAKHMGKTKLWIKPTDKLSRAIFEVDFWDGLRSEFTASLVVPVAEEKKAAPVASVPNTRPSLTAMRRSIGTR